MRTDNQYVNTLEGNIRARGAMSKFISDSDKYEVRNCEYIISWVIFIYDWKSEPHYQHNTFYESHYHIVKRLTNTIRDSTGAPDCMYLLSLINV